MASTVRRAGIVLAVSALAVVGCLLPDLGAISGTELDASTSDVALADVAIVPDATTDGDAGPTRRFCETYDAATDRTVCEDMDLPNALSLGWSKSDGSTLTDALVVSPPRALDVSFTGSGSCIRNSTAWVAAAPNASGVHLEADVNMVKSAVGGGPSYYLAVTWSGPSATCAIIVQSQQKNVGVNASGDLLRLQYLTTIDASTINNQLAFGTGAFWPNGDAPPPTKYRHLVLDFDVDAKVPPKLSLDGDAMSVAFSDAGADAGTCAGMKLDEVRLGLHCGTNPDFHYRYDNVVITPR
jgi:hypothetical protein